MRAVLSWLTDAPLADSILGDLQEERRQKGIVWFWSALLRITAYAAWQRTREVAGGSPMRGGNTMQHAMRALTRRPGFTISAVLLLALGMGANTAVFSVVRAVLLRPLPYTNPERLVLIWNGLETAPGNKHGVLTGKSVAGIGATPDILRSFAVVESWEGNPSAWADLQGPAGAERLRGTWVTPNFFETLGARAATGRIFTSADRDARVAVISDGLWRRRFGADRGIIGQTVSVSVGGGAKRAAQPFTVVGVMAADFRFTYPRETEIYLPQPWNDIRNSNGLTYYVVGRLEDGITPGQAQSQLTAVARHIVSKSGWEPEAIERAMKRAAMLVEPIEDHMKAEVRVGVWLLAAVAALVLVIACVNLGLLLLSRTVDRRGELGLRAALGASRGRIVRQLAAECLLISVAGGLVGLAAAAICQPLVRSLMPPIVPRADLIGLDPIVLVFSGGLMVLTAFVCALAPAAFVLRRDLLAAVRSASAAATADRGVMASRRVVLIVQVAVVVLLLVGSGLLLRSFWRLQHVDLGFSADGVVTMETRLVHPKYRQPGRVAAFNRELLARVRAVPGVARAGLTTAVPMRGVDFRMVIGPAGQKLQLGNARTVDPEYFRIMNLRLLAGRTFTDQDTEGSEPVTVVSQAYGRGYFGEATPIGRALRSDGRDVRIVGVVADTRYADAAREPSPAFYIPLAQAPSTLLCVVAEPQPGMRAAVAEGLREAVRAIDPEQPVEGITTIDQIVSRSTSDRRFYAVTTGAFAAVALALAIAGVFGVVSRTVSERKRELAIRFALGAAPRRLLHLVYGYGLFPAAAGTAVGLIAAYAGSRLLRGFLFEIAPTDAATFAGAAITVLAVTAAACYLPARRTLRVQPMAVLKSD
jgi:putative ABC transport system permease protein